MKRRLGLLYGVGVVLIGTTAFGALRFLAADANVAVLDVGKDFPVRNPRDEEAGLCPWRQPDADRARFFHGATSAREETLILSGQRSVVAHWLGRQPTGQENAIQIHRIMQPGRHGDEEAGAIVTRCVAGESGLIELVLAVDPNGSVRGARLQRLREPEPIARELQSDRFLGAFRGKTRTSAWKLNQDFPAVSASAQVSASALLAGAHTALVLLTVGEQTLQRR